MFSEAQSLNEMFYRRSLYQDLLLNESQGTNLKSLLFFEETQPIKNHDSIHSSFDLRRFTPADLFKEVPNLMEKLRSRV